MSGDGRGDPRGGLEAENTYDRGKKRQGPLAWSQNPLRRMIL